MASESEDEWENISDYSPKTLDEIMKIEETELETTPLPEDVDLATFLYTSNSQSLPELNLYDWEEIDKAGE
jgi:hypothetical protein